MFTEYSPPSIFLLNARSVLPKFDDLYITVLNLRPDIVMVSESWLCDDIQDDMLAIPCYRFFRADRPARRGGGVCVWVCDKYQANVFAHSTICPTQIEALVLEIIFGNRRIILVTLYIPPGLPKSVHEDIR